LTCFAAGVEVETMELNTLDSELRLLLGKYGIMSVHQSLMRQMAESFAYLQTVFPPAKNEIITPAPHLSPKLSPFCPPSTIAMTKDNIPEIILDSDTIVMDDDDEEEEKPTVKPDPNVKTIQITNPGKSFQTPVKPVQPSQPPPAPVKPPQPIVKPVSSVSTPVKLSPNAQKVAQREAVLAKRKELEAKGINPDSLITKESLEKWLNRGWSYMQIARETGVDASSITSIAKLNGLQSQKAAYRYNYNQKKQAQQTTA
jgi:hypothetical protein